MRFLTIEGNRQHLDGGAMFGNAPKEMWKRWIEPDALNRIPLACRSLLLQTDDGKNILFDAGVGAFFEPKLKERFGIEPTEHLLFQNLKKIDIQETDIDAVILSHLHFDHAGGLLPPHPEPQNRLLFPNAKYYVGAKHWIRAQNPHPREKASFLPQLHALLKNSNRLNLIECETHPDFSFDIRFQLYDGHTLGLMVSIIESLAFVSDLVPGLPWMHLPIIMGYDRFPERSSEEKGSFLAWAKSTKTLLFFTHDPHVAMASVHQDDRGKYYGKEVNI